MLTLTHNWKTFQWIGDKWGSYDIETYNISVRKDWKNNDLVWFKEDLSEYSGSICTFHTPEQLVKLGYLEQVKSLSQKRAEQIERGKEKSEAQIIMEKLDQFIEDSDCICKKGVMWKPNSEQSILSKLRETFEKERWRQDEAMEKHDIESQSYIYFEWKRDGILLCENILTSLESQEEEKETEEAPKKLKMEVSCDRVLKSLDKFQKNYAQSTIKVPPIDNTCSSTPLQPQENIKLPAFQAMRFKDTDVYVAPTEDIAIQVELLTETVNQLIQANKQ